MKTLKQLLSMLLTVVDIKPGDVTGDERINSRDGLILMRYLNGWNVNLG